MKSKKNRARKSYADYGLTEEMAKEIMGRCREAPDMRLIQEAAKKANPFVADQVARSIAEGKSYDRLKREGYVPYGKSNFYAYRREAIYELGKQMGGMEGC